MIYSANKLPAAGGGASSQECRRRDEVHQSDEGRENACYHIDGDDHDARHREHVIDKELVTKSEDKFKVWAYTMTQYNLKPGLRKFGARGTTAAVDKLTQLHIMDTWTAMDPSKIS